MALPVEQQVRYWSVATVIFVLALWFLGDVLLPFILGGAIAYLLDPVADRLERAGLSRVAATVLITLGAVLAFIVLALLVIPALVIQLIDLFNTIPKLLRDLHGFLQTNFPNLLEEGSVFQQTLNQIGQNIQARGAELLQTIVGSALSLLNVIVLLVIAPVVAVYLLLDWDRMIAQIDELLPRDHAPVIRKLAADIDAALSSFLRGMGLVCLILGTYYAVALMLVGLNFGLAVGFIAGLVTFIPYLGALIGGALAIGLALFQFWGDWASIGLVAGVFMLGQFVEGNFLTPKLVGDSVGLHPVWLLLALSVFGALFGFVGMLVAVPVAAMIGVVARYFVDSYKHGRLYRGLSEPQADTAEQDAE